MTLTLSPPRSLGATFSKIFFGVGLALPFVTGVVSVAFLQMGLINQVEVYPWDQILSALFFLALLVTPESICIYLFYNKIIRGAVARMGFLVIVVFVYANYIVLPPSVYTVLPVTAATLVWAVWPPLATLALGLAAGKIESKRVFAEGSSGALARK